MGPPPAHTETSLGMARGGISRKDRVGKTGGGDGFIWRQRQSPAIMWKTNIKPDSDEYRGSEYICRMATAREGREDCE